MPISTRYGKNAKIAKFLSQLGMENAKIAKCLYQLGMEKHKNRKMSISILYGKNVKCLSKLIVFFIHTFKHV